MPRVTPHLFCSPGVPGNPPAEEAFDPIQASQKVTTAFTTFMTSLSTSQDPVTFTELCDTFITELQQVKLLAQKYKNPDSNSIVGTEAELPKEYGELDKHIEMNALAYGMLQLNYVKNLIIQW